MTRPSTQPAPRPAAGHVAILIGTCKGGFIIRGDCPASHVPAKHVSPPTFVRT
jgi:hypothetical protein